MFTRQINELLADNEYRILQKELYINPESGSLIRQSSGLRKLRWKTDTKGKRGGIRIIYYWYTSEKQIFMLLAYGKNEKDDLSKKELKILRSLVKEYLS